LQEIKHGQTLGKSKAKPSQAKPSQAKPSQAKPSQAKPSQDLPQLQSGSIQTIFHIVASLPFLPMGTYQLEVLFHDEL
jgi:hypothetical protein